MGDKSGEARATQVLWHISSLRGQFADACQQKPDIITCSESRIHRISGTWYCQGENLVLAEKRFRDDLKACLQAGDAPAVLKLSELTLEIVKDRGDDVAYTKELELAVGHYEQMQLVSRVGSKKLLLAQRYIDCGRLDEGELILIDACAALSSKNEHIDIAGITASFGYLRKL